MSEDTPLNEFTCPNCGEAIHAPAADGEQLLICPHCDSEMTIPDPAQATQGVEQATGENPIDNEAPWVVVEDDDDADADAPEEPADPQEDELDGLRIRQYAASRRAIYRSRSYALIAALVCLVAAVQLVFNAIGRFHGTTPGIRPYAYLCFALAGFLAFIYFLRRMLELNREVRGMHPHEPTNPNPDFTPLSDGSQRWKRLDDIQ